MEILSDATFKGNVSINGGNFSVTPKGKSDYLMVTNSEPNGIGSLTVLGSEFITGDLIVYPNAKIRSQERNGSVTVDSGMTINGDTTICGSFSVTRAGWGALIETTKSDADKNILNFHATEFNIFGDLSVNPTSPRIATNVISDDGHRTYALKVYGSEFVDGNLVVNKNLYVNASGTDGGISLASVYITRWSDLNNQLNFAKISTFTSPSIPANCTAFEFTGTAISDKNKTHMIQVQNTSTGKSVIAETWMTTNKKPAMSFAGCTSTIAAGTYTAMVI